MGSYGKIPLEIGVRIRMVKRVRFLWPAVVPQKFPPGRGILSTRSVTMVTTTCVTTAFSGIPRRALSIYLYRMSQKYGYNWLKVLLCFPSLNNISVVITLVYINELGETLCTLSVPTLPELSLRPHPPLHPQRYHHHHCRCTLSFVLKK